jgi:ketosteroid isomerase-like protein
MRARLSLVVVALLAGSVSAQQPASTDTVRRPKTSAPGSLVPIGAPAPSASDAAKIAEVLAFERDMEAAVVRGDARALEKFLADDFLFTHGDGWVEGGAPLKVDTKTSWLKYVATQPPPYFYRELDHVQVELHGDIALTIGRYLYLPRTSDPRPTTTHLYVWFERVYAKQNGAWKHLSHRTTKGPVREDDEPKPASTK